MRRLTIGFVQHHVAGAYGLDLRMLTSRRRSQKLVRARQIAMYLACDLLPGCSLPQIGRAFGRDHTTVIHARRVVTDLCARDARFQTLVESLRVSILTRYEPPPTGEAAAAAEAALALASAFRRAVVEAAARNPARFLASLHSTAEALDMHEGIAQQLALLAAAEVESQP